MRWLNLSSNRLGATGVEVLARSPALGRLETLLLDQTALGVTGVERFLLPKLGACNFLLRNILGGGAAESLRTDSQGKAQCWKRAHPVPYRGARGYEAMPSRRGP